MARLPRQAGVWKRIHTYTMSVQVVEGAMTTDRTLSKKLRTIRHDAEDGLPNSLTSIEEAWKRIRKKGRRFTHERGDDSSWTGLEVPLELVDETQFALRVMSKGLLRVMGSIDTELESTGAK